MWFEAFRLRNYLPAGLLNTGNLALVSQLAEADTAYAEVTQISMGSAADLAAVVAAGGELVSSLLLENHCFSCHFVFLQLSVERSAGERQELFGFFVGGCRGADANVHATDLVNLIVRFPGR